MRKIQLCLLVLTAVFATGCPTYRPSVDFKNVNTFRGRLNDHLANEQIKYQCYRVGKDYDDSTKPPRCSGASGSVPNGADLAKRVRNDLIDDAMSYIDDAYGDFKNDLAAGRDRANFIADLVDLGTSGAVGITKGQRPLQILGVALTAFRGGRRSADAAFFKDQSTPILISKMNGNRAAVRASILDSEKKPIDDYAIGRAISDIVDYYNAGTLVEAFNKLAEDTAVQTRANETAVRVVRGDLEISDIPTVEREVRSTSIFQQRLKLEGEVDKLTTQGNAAAATITIPSGAGVTQQQIDAANLQRAQKLTDTLKPIRDKLVVIWKDIAADPALTGAVNKLRADARYTAILAKLDANPPQPITEDDYLDLLTGLQGATKDDANAAKAFLAILVRDNR
jgi:hypothetical protein